MYHQNSKDYTLQISISKLPSNQRDLFPIILLKIPPIHFLRSVGSSNLNRDYGHRNFIDNRSQRRFGNLNACKLGVLKWVNLSPVGLALTLARFNFIQKRILSFDLFHELA